jgi:hypothetical protein
MSLRGRREPLPHHTPSNLARLVHPRQFWRCSAQPVTGRIVSSEFLSALKSSVCSAAEEALRDTLW